MSDAISAAFCDLSEISCHWVLRHGLFNSAGDCHVPNTSVTVSSCLRAREMYLNKRAPTIPYRGRTPHRSGRTSDNVGPPLSPDRRRGRHVNTLSADTELYPREWSQVGFASHVTYIWWLKADVRCLTRVGASQQQQTRGWLCPFWVDPTCRHMTAAAACLASAEKPQAEISL